MGTQPVRRTTNGRTSSGDGWSLSAVVAEQPNHFLSRGSFVILVHFWSVEGPLSRRSAAMIRSINTTKWTGSIQEVGNNTGSDLGQDREIDLSLDRPRRVESRVFLTSSSVHYDAGHPGGGWKSCAVNFVLIMWRTNKIIARPGWDCLKQAGKGKLGTNRRYWSHGDAVYPRYVPRTERQGAVRDVML